MTVAPQTIAYGTAAAALTASVAYSGSVAPTGALTFRVDTGTSVTGTCSGTASPLTCDRELPDFELDGWVAYDHGDGCGRC